MYSCIQIISIQENRVQAIH